MVAWIQGSFLAAKVVASPSGSAPERLVWQIPEIWNFIYLVIVYVLNGNLLNTIDKKQAMKYDDYNR